MTSSKSSTSEAQEGSTNGFRVDTTSGPSTVDVRSIDSTGNVSVHYLAGESNQSQLRT